MSGNKSLFIACLAVAFLASSTVHAFTTAAHTHTVLSSRLKLHQISHKHIALHAHMKDVEEKWSPFPSLLSAEAVEEETSDVLTAAMSSNNQINLQSFSVLLVPIIAFFLSMPEPAIADASQYGILAGRTASMMHPITNFALFATSLYSAYLGFQWRRLRDLSEEIKALNSELPKLNTMTAKFPLADTMGAISQEISTLSSTEGNDAKLTLLKKDLETLRKYSDLEDRYKSLTGTRKSLQSANLKDKHHLTGSILLGAGVSVSLLGAFNTYMRAGRLFPGPHLFAGMAITILWAVAASLVPAMQKGNEGARVAHIGLNVINILLFAWQVPTGIEIMLNVWNKTHW